MIRGSAKIDISSNMISWTSLAYSSLSLSYGSGRKIDSDGHDCSLGVKLGDLFRFLNGGTSSSATSDDEEGF